MDDPLFRTPENHVTRRHPRIMGPVIIATGLLLAKWQIYDPLHAAQQHVREVWIFGELIGAFDTLHSFWVSRAVVWQQGDRLVRNQPTERRLEEGFHAAGFRRRMFGVVYRRCSFAGTPRVQGKALGAAATSIRAWRVWAACRWPAHELEFQHDAIVHAGILDGRRLVRRPFEGGSRRL